MKQRFAASSRSLSPLPFGPKTLVLGAAALIAYGLTRRSKSGTALATAGGVLAFTAAKSQSASSLSDARATFLVNAPVEEAYRLWRNLDNLPRFMSHLKSVRILDDRRSEWVGIGPMNKEIRWNAEITEDRPDQRIAWRTLPGSQVDNSGYVEFRRDPLNRGTYVTAQVRYNLPTGKGIATAFGKHPEFIVHEDLRRFKSLLETGEVPTTVGQTHGPRGIHGYAEQVLFRETRNQPRPQPVRAFGKSA
jgi:uncharacterized membrane protein